MSSRLSTGGLKRASIGGTSRAAAANAAAASAAALAASLYSPASPSKLMAQQPQAHKKQRRSVSFGGAHVRMFDKQDATQTVSAMMLRRDENGELLNDDAEAHAATPEEEDDDGMELTRSYTSRIEVIPAAAPAAQADEDDKDDEVTFGAGVGAGAGQEDAEAEEEDQMELTRSYTSRIEMPPVAAAIVPSVSLASTLPELDESQLSQEEVTMDFTRSFTGAIVLANGSSGEAAAPSAGFLSPLSFPAGSPRRSPRRSIGMHGGGADPGANNDEVTMDFTRSFTSRIEHAAATPAPVTSELNLTGKFQDDVLHIVHAQKTEATADLPRFESMGQETKQIHKMIKGLITGKAQTPTQALPSRQSLAAQQAAQDEMDQEPDNEEVSMEFTTAHAPIAASPAASPVAAAAAVATPRASPRALPPRASPVAKALPMPSPSPVRKPAAPAVAASVVAAPRVQQSQPQALSVAWPPSTVQGWLECVFLDAKEMEEAQAACMHLLEETDNLREKTAAAQSAFDAAYMRLPLVQFLQRTFPTFAGSLFAQLKSGSVPQSLDCMPAKLVAVLVAISQFHTRVSMECNNTWTGAWSYAQVETSYNKLMDTQMQLQADAQTMQTKVDAVAAQHKALASLGSPEALQLREEMAANCRRMLATLRDFSALKVAESAADARARLQREQLHQRVLLKSAQLSLSAAESDLTLLRQMVGFTPRSLTSTGALLEGSDGTYELEVSWDAAGVINPSSTQVRLVNVASWAGKDRECIEGVFASSVLPALRVVLAALTHRKLLYLIVPHVAHLMGRVEAVRAELAEMRRHWTVRSAANGTAEVTISCVASMGQVIVTLQLASLHQQLRSGAPSMLASPAETSLEIVARPAHLAHLTVASLRALVNDHAKEGAPAKATKICNFLQKLIAKQ